MHRCGIPSHSIAWWLVIGCWATVCVVWLLGSLYNYRHSGKVERRGSSGVWRIILVVNVLALWLIPATTWDVFNVCAAWMAWAGAAVLLAGTAFTLWARFALGTMWSAMPTRRTGHELRTDGPYRVTRHPIYTGLISMVLGTALLDGIGAIGPALVLIVVGLIFKLRIEERLMREAFGDAYVAYQQRVPGLLPWPRPRHERISPMTP